MFSRLAFAILGILAVTLPAHAKAPKLAQKPVISSAPTAASAT